MGRETYFKKYYLENPDKRAKYDKEKYALKSNKLKYKRFIERFKNLSAEVQDMVRNYFVE
jgi:hypothetical protein